MSSSSSSNGEQAREPPFASNAARPTKRGTRVKECRGWAPAKAREGKKLMISQPCDEADAWCTNDDRGGLREGGV